MIPPAGGAGGLIMVDDQGTALIWKPDSCMLKQPFNMERVPEAYVALFADEPGEAVTDRGRMGA